MRFSSRLRPLTAPTRAASIVVAVLSLSGCNAVNNLQLPSASALTPAPAYDYAARARGATPRIGMSYAEFETTMRASGYEGPKAITTSNNYMIYALPYQTEIYFWFKDGHLKRVTEILPDDPNSWQRNEISPANALRRPFF